MKNRVITVIATFMMGLMLTACGSGEPASAPSVADSDKAAVQEKLNKQDSKTDETKADENTVIESTQEENVSEASEGVESTEVTDSVEATETSAAENAQ